jgi:hypothetical protein
VSYDAPRERWAFIIVFVICTLVSCTTGVGLTIGDVGIGLDEPQRTWCRESSRLIFWCYLISFFLALFGVAWARARERFVALALGLFLIGPTVLAFSLSASSVNKCNYERGRES